MESIGARDLKLGSRRGVGSNGSVAPLALDARLPRRSRICRIIAAWHMHAPPTHVHRFAHCEDRTAWGIWGVPRGQTGAFRARGFTSLVHVIGSRYSPECSPQNLGARGRTLGQTSDDPVYPDKARREPQSDAW